VPWVLVVSRLIWNRSVDDPKIQLVASLIVLIDRTSLIDRIDRRDVKSLLPSLSIVAIVEAVAIRIDRLDRI
jgi:hypothetical protein